ncbi:hypothetical protein [Deinococcus radiophilus]|uniref:hypothetical protein n=1 Tax=Deinococcus radiophilus TaxID=32062 RepID=UPI00361A502C
MLALTSPARSFAAADWAATPWDELRPVLAGWLAGPVRVAEVGLRGYLRSAEGYTEWVPWRRNVILRRDNLSGVQLREGEKYVLE